VAARLALAWVPVIVFVMSFDLPPSEAASRPESLPVRPRDLERARGKVSLGVNFTDGRHAIRDLGQAGCGRLLFPARTAAQPLEAVVVNTAGGLTGGDRFDVSVKIDEGAVATITSQACEKIYRASDRAAILSARLTLARGAALHWLPQETILFDGSALDRSLTIDMDSGATLLAAEAVLLGRQAMGEVVETARLKDRWRIRRGGRLVFAEETAVDGARGDWAALRSAKALLGDQAAAMATIVHVAPDAGARLDAARAIMESTDIDGGASAFDGLLVMRMVAPSGLILRKTLIRVLELCGGRPLPRVWMT
jgi:urease accessory protein